MLIVDIWKVFKLTTCQNVTKFIVKLPVIFVLKVTFQSGILFVDKVCMFVC